jgi:hypothetical protein
MGWLNGKSRKERVTAYARIVWKILRAFSP